MEILLVNFVGCFICHLVLNLQIISLLENKLHVICMQTDTNCIPCANVGVNMV